MNPRPAALVRARLTALACTLLLFSGCLHRSPPPLVPAPQGAYATPEELLSAMRERGQALGALRATGVLEVGRGIKSLRTRTVALVRRPALLRFEMISLFEQPMSILVINGMEFSLWNMEEGRFLTGPATQDNISLVLPVPLDGPELAGLLLGEPPLCAYASALLAWDESRGRYRLTLANARQEQTLLVHPVTLRAERVLLREGGKTLYELTIEEWKAATPPLPPVPQKLVLSMPERKIRVVLKLREVEIDPALGDSLFELAPPQNTPIEQLP